MSIIGFGGVPQIIPLLRSSHEEICYYAITCLSRISVHSSDGASTIAVNGAIPFITPLLCSRHAVIISSALLCLIEVCKSPSSHASILASNLFQQVSYLIKHIVEQFKDINEECDLNSDNKQKSCLTPVNETFDVDISSDTKLTPKQMLSKNASLILSLLLSIGKEAILKAISSDVISAVVLLLSHVWSVELVEEHDVDIVSICAKIISCIMCFPEARNLGEDTTCTKLLLSNISYCKLSDNKHIELYESMMSALAVLLAPDWVITNDSNHFLELDKLPSSGIYSEETPLVNLINELTLEYPLVINELSRTLGRHVRDQDICLSAKAVNDLLCCMGSLCHSNTQSRSFYESGGVNFVYQLLEESIPPVLTLLQSDYLSSDGKGAHGVYQCNLCLRLLLVTCKYHPLSSKLLVEDLQCLKVIECCIPIGMLQHYKAYCAKVDGFFYRHLMSILAYELSEKITSNTELVPLCAHSSLFTKTIELVAQCCDVLETFGADSPLIYDGLLSHMLGYIANVSIDSYATLALLEQVVREGIGESGNSVIELTSVLFELDNSTNQEGSAHNVLEDSYISKALCLLCRVFTLNHHKDKQTFKEQGEYLPKTEVEHLSTTQVERIHEKARKMVVQLNILPLALHILEQRNTCDDCVIHGLRLLAELCDVEENKVAIAAEDGVSILLHLLNSSNIKILCHSSEVLTILTSNSEIQVMVCAENGFHNIIRLIKEKIAMVSVELEAGDKIHSCEDMGSNRENLPDSTMNAKLVEHLLHIIRNLSFSSNRLSVDEDAHFISLLLEFLEAHALNSNFVGISAAIMECLIEMMNITPSVCYKIFERNGLSILSKILLQTRALKWLKCSSLAQLCVRALCILSFADILTIKQNENFKYIVEALSTILSDQELKEAPVALLVEVESFIIRIVKSGDEYMSLFSTTNIFDHILLLLDHTDTKVSRKAIKIWLSLGEMGHKIGIEKREQEYLAKFIVHLSSNDAKLRKNAARAVSFVAIESKHFLKDQDDIVNQIVKLLIGNISAVGESVEDKTLLAFMNCLLSLTTVEASTNVWEEHVELIAVCGNIYSRKVLEETENRVFWDTCFTTIEIFASLVSKSQNFIEVLLSDKNVQSVANFGKGKFLDSNFGILFVYLLGILSLCDGKSSIVNETCHSIPEILVSCVGILEMAKEEHSSIFGRFTRLPLKDLRESALLVSCCASINLSTAILEYAWRNGLVRAMLAFENDEKGAHLGIVLKSFAGFIGSSLDDSTLGDVITFFGQESNTKQIERILVDLEDSCYHFLVQVWDLERSIGVSAQFGLDITSCYSLACRVFARLCSMGSKIANKIFSQRIVQVLLRKLLLYLQDSSIQQEGLEDGSSAVDPRCVHISYSIHSILEANPLPHDKSFWESDENDVEQVDIIKVLCDILMLSLNNANLFSVIGDIVSKLDWKNSGKWGSDAEETIEVLLRHFIDKVRGVIPEESTPFILKTVSALLPEFLSRNSKIELPNRMFSASMEILSQECLENSTEEALRILFYSSEKIHFDDIFSASHQNIQVLMQKLSTILQPSLDKSQQSKKFIALCLRFLTKCISFPTLRQVVIHGSMLANVIKLGKEELISFGKPHPNVNGSFSESISDKFEDHTFSPELFIAYCGFVSRVGSISEESRGSDFILNEFDYQQQLTAISVFNQEELNESGTWSLPVYQAILGLIVCSIAANKQKLTETSLNVNETLVIALNKFTSIMEMICNPNFALNVMDTPEIQHHYFVGLTLALKSLSICLISIHQEEKLMNTKATACSLIRALKFVLNNAENSEEYLAASLSCLESILQALARVSLLPQENSFILDSMDDLTVLFRILDIKFPTSILNVAVEAITSIIEFPNRESMLVEIIENQGEFIRNVDTLLQNLDDDQTTNGLILLLIGIFRSVPNSFSKAGNIHKHLMCVWQKYLEHNSSYSQQVLSNILSLVKVVIQSHESLLCLVQMGFVGEFKKALFLPVNGVTEEKSDKQISQIEKASIQNENIGIEEQKEQSKAEKSESEEENVVDGAMDNGRNCVSETSNKPIIEDMPTVVASQSYTPNDIPCTAKILFLILKCGTQDETIITDVINVVCSDVNDIVLYFALLKVEKLDSQNREDISELLGCLVSVPHIQKWALKAADIDSIHLLLFDWVQSIENSLQVEQITPLGLHLSQIVRSFCSDASYVSKVITEFTKGVESNALSSLMCMLHLFVYDDSLSHTISETSQAACDILIEIATTSHESILQVLNTNRVETTDNQTIHNKYDNQAIELGEIEHKSQILSKNHLPSLIVSCLEQCLSKSITDYKEFVIRLVRLLCLLFKARNDTLQDLTLHRSLGIQTEKFQDIVCEMLPVAFTAIREYIGPCLALLVEAAKANEFDAAISVSSSIVMNVINGSLPSSTQKTIDFSSLSEEEMKFVVLLLAQSINDELIANCAVTTKSQLWKLLNLGLLSAFSACSDPLEQPWHPALQLIIRVCSSKENVFSILATPIPQCILQMVAALQLQIKLSNRDSGPVATAVSPTPPPVPRLSSSRRPPRKSSSIERSHSQESINFTRSPEPPHPMMSRLSSQTAVAVLQQCLLILSVFARYDEFHSQLAHALPSTSPHLPCLVLVIQNAVANWTREYSSLTASAFHSVSVIAALSNSDKHKQVFDAHNARNSIQSLLTIASNSDNDLSTRPNSAIERFYSHANIVLGRLQEGMDESTVGDVESVNIRQENSSTVPSLPKETIRTKKTKTRK